VRGGSRFSGGSNPAAASLSDPCDARATFSRKREKETPPKPPRAQNRGANMRFLLIFPLANAARVVR